MGDHSIKKGEDAEQLRRFTKNLLRDVKALEVMLERGMVESGVRRIGAEQEVFLVDNSWQPAPLGMEVLEELDDADYTTELARYNLEFNLPPLRFGTDCLRQLENQLSTRLAKLREAAKRRGAHVCLAGILPTLAKSDLDLRNMSPMPRYFALNDALNRIRGEDYQFRISGTDELIVRHDSVMLESCNTSFQIHFQVGPSEFARLYNLAQLVSAPILAASTNSPLLFGKRLWRETRIALFEQAIDTRTASRHLRDVPSRVRFGDRWVQESVLEIYREDISRFRVLLGAETDEDPFALIEAGTAPKLKALCLHNSTVYRWNRACYGVLDGKAHLRIENRVLPAGPSVVDAVANAAFYYGLMSRFSDEYEDVSELIDFADVHTNFLAAAQHGLGAQFTWLNRQTIPAQRLICSNLLPMAREGLQNRGILEDDIERYLSILDRRVRGGQTGSQWMLNSLAAMKESGLKAERTAALTAGAVSRQIQGEPVHKWSLADLSEAGGWKPNYQRVEQIMTTELFTVREGDSVDLVANLMDWERIRHILVEDDRQNLVGLVSYRSVLKYLGEHLSRGEDGPPTVTKIMRREPYTVTPETTTVKAMEIMRRHSIGCLPVVKEGRLVGVITERDFMRVARDLLEKSLREEEEGSLRPPVTPSPQGSQEQSQE